ncbi:MAG: gliding motility-associated C-terminal domain-containing protein [Bacteroidota bacterium]
MKKCLLLVALLTLSQLNLLFGQGLFNYPPIVCVNQPVTITSNVPNRANYYWGFCSGSLQLTPTSVSPTGTNLGDNFGFNGPANIDIVEDSGMYYGFVVNFNTNRFLRLNYGNSLTNTPTYTDFGDLTQGLPENPSSLFIIRDSFSRNWYVFVAGGTTAATSELARIDFGLHLSNPNPNIANFGNHTGLLNAPRGIFISKDNTDDKYYGYVVNYNSSQLIRMDFSFNISNTPLMASMGNVDGVLNFPSDMAGIKDADKWYLFVTNFGSSTVSRIDLGADLHPVTPAGVNLGNFVFRILRPSSISINRDCGMIHAYITDSTTSQLVGIQMPTAVGPYTAIDYNNIGLMNFPAGISSIIRYKDDLYGFITNAADSTLTRFVFKQCTNSSIPSYTEVNPPTYIYDAPGYYNIYFVVDQGLPTQQVECRTIQVLPKPPIFMSSDTTICKGDTIHVYAVSSAADSIIWAAGHNIDTLFQAIDSVKLYPDYATSYDVTFYYPFGCIVDTTLKVDVRTVTADAGPDRFIYDGATTVLGGPYTATGGSYIYRWSPYQFLSDSSVTNPYANPPYDFTYYLTVSEAMDDGLVCSATDTVVVRLTCGDIYAPNAFAPSSNNAGTSRFTILNRGLAKLAYFRVYNRWGALVFETTDPTLGWDGLYKGQPAPVGVYVWEAEGFCASGKKLKKSGNVSLLR